MFFQGNLQEGIAAALQQAKTVVCFVTDGGDESKQWEEELLVDDSVKPLLESEAVVLRLEAGSEGEGFLAQLYPIPKKPTLVIIKNAELKEYVAAGVSKEDFFSRLQKALQPTQPPAQPAPQAVPTNQTQPTAASASASQEASTGQAAPSSSNASGSNAAQIQAVLAERAARLEVKRKKDAEEARRQRIEKDKAKAKELAENPEKKAEPQNKYAEQIRKQKRQAQEERARILKAIEDDKAARRARQADRAAERRAASEAHDVPFAPASQLLPSSGRLSEHCALQVRLLDGSTIRTKFSSQDTLAKEVREWVDESRADGSTPYTFKVLLTPLPNKTIDVTEEGKSLQELGLAPNATLIILPVQKSAAAYQGNSEGNIISRAIAYILSWITGFFGVIATFFSTLFSTAGPPQAPEGQAPASDRAQGRTTGRDDQGNRIKGLRPEDERRRRDQQFYNGNSTNFEPNYDDEDQ